MKKSKFIHQPMSCLTHRVFKIEVENSLSTHPDKSTLVVALWVFILFLLSNLAGTFSMSI